MAEIFDSAIVAKRNVLNELRSNNMTLQELRFFSIYLSKINPWDKSTRTIRFPIEDFRKIMNFGKLNIGQLKESTNSLLRKVVNIPLESGGYEGIVLFDKCKVDKDKNGEWFVEINASNAAAPLMFDFKERYFTYKLWNALRLRSPSQIRMYEILKQYEKLGKRELTIEELRELLGIEKNEYSGRTGWSDFKKRILDSCQQALKETTDICYTYARGKAGKGGKWLTIIFNIEKNNDYIDQLTLNEYMDIQLEPNSNVTSSNEKQAEEIDYGSDLGNLLGEALDNEFTPEQIRVLQDLVIKVVPSSDAIERCNYLVGQVHRMNIHTPTNRYSYLCRMIENDIVDQESND